MPWHSICFLGIYVPRNMTAISSHTSRGKVATQIDFIFFHWTMPKLVTDVKVIPGEEVALQHQLLVCDMRIGVPPKSKFTPSHWFIYSFIPMCPRTRLGYIKWVLLENHCDHYRIFHYNFVSPGTRWDLKCESQSKNWEYRTRDAQLKKSLLALKFWKLKYHHKQLFPEGLQLACSSADSRRAVVSFWRKNVYNTG